MTRLATSWLVYRLTDSAMLLGVVNFAGQIPVFILSPLAGVWVDRWDRHRAMIVTQALAMTQSLALAALALSGTINIGWIIFLTTMQGLVNTFETPARQAFMVQMIDDRAALGNAIALNSSIVNGGRLVGPAIAGLVIAAVGEGYCFLIDGLSYIAVIYSLLAMRIKPEEGRRQETHVWQELVEGWQYVVKTPPIRWILLMLSLVSLIAMPYSVLLPIMAGNVLKGGAHTLGFLSAAAGLGALTAAVSLAVRKSVRGLSRWIGFASAIMGGSLILFGLSRWFWVSLILMLGTGFGMMQQIAGSNTILQTITADDKRGRVMSFYALSVLGFTPIGSLLAGMLASRIGAPATMITSGVLCGCAAIWFMGRLPEIRREIRPIYIELGIVDVPAVQPNLER